MIAHDKVLHLAAGAAISLVAIWWTGNPVVAFLAGLIAGLLKEVYDRIAGGDVDEWDVVATAMPGTIILALGLL